MEFRRRHSPYTAEYAKGVLSLHFYSSWWPRSLRKARKQFYERVSSEVSHCLMENPSKFSHSLLMMPRFRSMDHLSTLKRLPQLWICLAKHLGFTLIGTNVHYTGMVKNLPHPGYIPLVVMSS